MFCDLMKLELKYLAIMADIAFGGERGKLASLQLGSKIVAASCYFGV